MEWKKKQKKRKRPNTTDLGLHASPKYKSLGQCLGFFFCAGANDAPSAFIFFILYQATSHL